MKKYYEYDAPVLTKLLSVVAVIAICVSMATSALCCYKVATMQTGSASAGTSTSSNSSGTSTNTSSGTSTNTNSGTNTNTNSGTSTNTNSGTSTDANGGSSTDANGGSSGQTSGGLEGLSTNEEILAKYTEVMNDAKSKKPAFNKVEYQELPESYRNLGTVGNTVLSLASNYMTTEEKAKADPQVKEAGSDMHAWPVSGHDTAGCLLTDASKIKSASAVQDGDNIKLTITLVDEVDPEPVKEANATSAPSATGAMFSPLSKTDIDNEVANISVVKVNSYSLTYTDCTATLVYNPSNNQVVSLDQIMNVDIVANAKITIVTLDGSARLVNTMSIYDVKY